MEEMSKLGAVVEAVEKHGRFVLEQVKRARRDEKFGHAVIERWNKIKAETPIAKAPTGLPLPRLALPEIDEPGEIARYLFSEGLPGEFPYLNGAYREMYLEPLREIETGSYGNKKSSNGDSNGAIAARVSRAKRIGAEAARPPPQEEPTRLFSGLMLAEDTNKRFHFLSAHQRSKRLSTAFDGPTLYGIDSDADGVFGKIGEGGVAVDTVEDMVRLYDGFELGAPNFSASMTISGPAPIIMAMYIAAAKRRFGPKVVPNLRGTIQADIFKEVQAQNETIFPTEASLRFLCDMIEWTTANMPRWYPVSISGYHIGEAGSTPVQQAAYTLSNGFAYAEMLTARGVPVDQFAPRLSFFLDCGLDVEYIALAAGFAKDLGNRHAGCLRRERARTNVQVAHADERAFAHRGRIQKQPHPNGGGVDAGLHERHQLLSFQQRRRTFHHAERRMDPARRPWTGDPARRIGNL